MSDDEMHETSSESGSQLMPEDSTYLLIEVLEIQVQELINEKNAFKKQSQ